MLFKKKRVENGKWGIEWEQAKNRHAEEQNWAKKPTATTIWTKERKISNKEWAQYIRKGVRHSTSTTARHAELAIIDKSSPKPIQVDSIWRWTQSKFQLFVIAWTAPAFIRWAEKFVSKSWPLWASSVRVGEKIATFWFVLSKFYTLFSHIFLTPSLSSFHSVP